MIVGWGGGGVWGEWKGIFSLHEFFCAQIFIFLLNPLHKLFFFNIAFSQRNFDSLSSFVLYKLFYTHNKLQKGCRPLL